MRTTVTIIPTSPVDVLEGSHRRLITVSGASCTALGLSVSLVLWQALLQDGRTGLAYATLASGLSLALGLGFSIYFAQAARRELRRAERARRDFSTEVCERRRAEAALRESDDRLRLAIDTAELGAFDFYPQTGRLVSSDCVKRHFGLAAEADIDTETLLGRLDPTDRERVQRCFQGAVQPPGGGEFAVEFRTIGGDECGPRWLSMGGRVFFEPDGRPVRVIGMTRDITERKRGEEALLQANGVLKEADQRKDEFLATLAHELRNPLAPIRFALRLLDSSDDDATARRSQDVIGRQVTQLVRLVDDLLDVSRVTRNTVELRRERIELSILMQSVAASVESFVTAAGHQLAFSVDGDAALEGDAARLVQVFTNLLHNAVKFTPAGGRILFASEIEGDQVVVRVRDNGIGIAPDALARIFDMFHQVDRSLERSSGGLGIGLALAKRLVELHGGAIEALSDGPNRGAEFRVHLPLKERAQAVVSKADAGESTEVTPRALSVLIVDDNRDSAEMLDLIVHARGHVTHMVYDGPSAVEAFDRVAPDVVLLDIGLPGMNGYNVAREIRNRGGNNVHLVAITGWGQSEDRRKAREAGFNCHMTKPADPRLVLAYLDAVAHGNGCDGCAKCIQTPLTRESDVPTYASAQVGGQLRAYVVACQAGSE